MTSRNAINAKNYKGSEERKCFYDLISMANDASAKASKTGALPAETSAVMEKFENSSLVPALGIFAPLLVVRTFVSKGNFIEIEKKR